MEKLMLGVARETITPKIGARLYGYNPNVISTSVCDDLNATVFYFAQGDTEALMISVEVCLISNALSAEILSLIEKECKISKKSIMLCATHTHSGPNTAGESGWGEIDREYCDSIFIPGILKATKAAKEALQPVTVGIGHGESKIGVNRREILFDNRIDFGQNPWGCYDPRMSIISFKGESGDIVANMIHYGCHGTCAGVSLEISRDWSGIMIDMLEKVSGGITAFFNGPEGDVGPRLSNGDTTGRGDMSYVRELGNMATHDAVDIFKSIYTYSDVSLHTSFSQIDIPLKKRMPLDEARSMYEKYKDNTINVGGMIRVHLENVINSHKKNEAELENFSVLQTAVGLGNLYFVSFPFELFSEIGLRIDKAFKNATVLSLSNTNGSEGYFSTADAVVRGGYETLMHLYSRPQQFCDDADWHLMKNTVEHIKSITEE